MSVQGTVGAAASQGSQGTQGLQGRQGTQGTSVQGAAGNVQGTQGTQGTSVQGAAGNVQGTQGTQGLQGRQGTQGTSVQGAAGSISGTVSTDTTFNANVTFTSNTFDSPIVSVTGDFVARDNVAGKILYCDTTASAGINIKCAVAATSGFSYTVIRKNTGNVFITANNASITKLNTSNYLSPNISTRYGAATVIYTATNEIVVVGDF